MTQNGKTSPNGYVQQVWSLDELFEGFNSAEIETAIADLKALVDQFETYRPRLDDQTGADTVNELLALSDQLQRRIARLYAFGSLRFAQNTLDQQAQVHMARMGRLVADLNNRTLFFELWWKEVADDHAETILAASGPFRYYLESLRKERPHTLSEPEERVLNVKNVNGPRALTQIYDSITNRYLYKLEVDGEVHELTRGELMVYARDANPDLRAAAYQALFRVFEQDAPVLGQIYQFRVRDWKAEHVQLRHHAAPIAVRNLANDVPDDAVNTLLDVARANVDIFQRYFRLKARWLGVERLRRYDIYAPISESDRRYPFDEAVQLVFESFAKFDPAMADLARRVFDEAHYDSEVRKNKDTGAFCSTVGPDYTPWVLQSYQGRPDDVATMAHELGHAVHSMLAEHHPALMQRSSLPLAETASTFGEMLLLDELLARDPDPGVQRDLLFREMDDHYGTILRQVFFALFEREAHDAIDNGASVDDLSALYLRTLREQFGDAVEVSDDFRFEWLAIPHIYAVPFYVYAYAFGQLLVLSLYQQYKQEGEAFKPRYRAILAAGGSDSPENILQRAGVDIRSAEFWQGGFDVIAASLARLEALPLPNPT